MIFFIFTQILHYEKEVGQVLFVCIIYLTTLGLILFGAS